MKSQRLKTYSLDGQQYHFNRTAFIDAIKNATQIRNSDGQTIRTHTQLSLFEKIADQLGITPEAVKNWKMGNNSPVDLHSIEVCASVLGIDCTCLLTPIDTKEASIMTNKEIELIERVYAECINSMYFLSNSCELYTEDIFKNTSIRQGREAEYLHSLASLHQMIDSTLLISSSVRYRLHRIICDMSESNIFLGMSERWSDINTTKDSEGNYHNRVASIHALSFYASSRIRGGDSDDFDLLYIEEEKALAEKLGFNYSEIPESFYKYDEESIPKDCNGKPVNICTICNINDLTEVELNGNILFKDLMTRFIKMVFVHDFPELNLSDSYFA